MKGLVFFAFVLTIFILNAPFAAASDSVTQSQMQTRSKNLLTQANLGETSSTADGKNVLRIYTASGKIENLTVPFEKYTACALYHGSETSIFVNDLEGGSKVDFELRNYTLLFHEGYLKNDDEVRVVVLTGKALTTDTYEMKTLNALEVARLSNIVRSFKGTVTSLYGELPYVSVEIPYEEISAFSQCDMIGHVFLDRKYDVCLSESVPIIKPPEEWQQIENQFGFEINGAGVKIAILDTGIDSTHPDLQGKIILEQCFTGEGKTTDGFGHGTHCASIAAGTGIASGYTYVGVAPAAVLLNGKVLTDGGWGYDSWIISGIEWAVEQGAQVLSMSFGGGSNGDGTDPISMTVDWVTDQGAVCVVAAGNDGDWGIQTLGSPAVSRKAITVGATTKDDYIASFSSQGPTLDYRLKPDVCAPGVDIVAARASGTTMGDPINDYYTRASGTSMATPHVAGAAALILQAHPDWTPVMVKSALMGNAKVLPNEHHWRQGAGRIDLPDAVNATLLVTEPSASFGVMNYTRIATATFTVWNTASLPQTVTASTITKCEEVETDYVHLNATSFTIPAHSKTAVLMTVGPLDENAPDGWFEGWFNISTNTRSNRAPYLFLVTSIIEVSMYDVDDITHIAGFITIVNHPSMSYVETQWIDAWQASATFLVRSGNYSVCAESGWVEGGGHFDLNRAFIIEKTLSVNKSSTIHIDIRLADAFTNEIPTVDSKGENLTVHTYTQYFCGDNSGGSIMAWSTQCIWTGWELRTAGLILYSSEYTRPDKLCEDLGFYASDSLQSEVYLFNWRFFNLPILPATITENYSKLAKFEVYYDMPETCPEFGLNLDAAFWFTWEHMGAGQTWVSSFHRIPAGLNATFYLTPVIAHYWGWYAATYSGWPEIPGLMSGPMFGPLQQWYIRAPNQPPMEREKGELVLGRFNFGPYAPGINLYTRHVGEHCIIELTGDLWAGLDWPHFWPMNYHPMTELPTYDLYVDGHEIVAGYLFALDQWGFVTWKGLSYSWNVWGSRATLQIHMPSIATISKETVYTVNFDLAEDRYIPPFFYQMQMPTKYSPNENITIKPSIPNVVSFHLSDISLSYSFDNEATWQVASKSPTNEFRLTCQAANQLAILINAEDYAGDMFEYQSNPVALCSKISLDKATADSLTIITATTLDGRPVSDVALRIDEDTNSFYAKLNPDGQVTLPAGLEPIKAWFPSVGLYANTVVPKPDIAIVDITLSTSEVYIGRQVDVYVKVKNLGEFVESFSVKCYCGATWIGTLSVDRLEPAMNITLTFSFYATGLILYADYPIRAEATFIAYETNTANNQLIKGSVRTRALGDVNGDREINILDIVQISGVYASRAGDINWNLYADLREQWGKIDILDIVTCASHYGEKY